MNVAPVTLEGRHVRLVPLAMSHVADLAAVGLDPALWEWTAGHVETPEQMRAYVERALRRQEAGDALPFAIVTTADRRVVGSTRFGSIDRTNRRVEIGWTWIGRPWQRTVVNTEAKYLMLRHAFETLGCVRVELKTDARNERSRQAILRLGARQEGVLRQHLVTSRGRLRDTVYFSILDREWPEARARLEARLADDTFELNRAAWNRQSAAGGEWSRPCTADEIRQAREGRLRLRLSPNLPVPDEWLGDVAGRDVLCLAGGGGQQGPLLAALGARVTVVDASEEQLAKDRSVAEREGFSMRTLVGNMADLSMLEDGSFDVVVNPASTMFVEDVRPVWREVFRVLRPGGRLLASLMNPIAFAFGRDALDGDAHPRLKHALPVADRDVLDPAEVSRRIEAGVPLEFSHTLERLLGGQMEAGLVLAGLYEDRWGPKYAVAGDSMFPQFIATLARKPAG